MAWHSSPPARLDRDTWFVIEGTDPWNRYALAPGPIGEHARWWLKLQTKYQRWPWWRVMPPPPITTIRFIKVTPRDRTLAMLVAAYAVLRAVLRR